MELELGLKITQSRGEDATATTSSVLVSKEGIGIPPFTFAETETMFLLVGNLSGFKKDQIKIGINKTGSKIVISGKKSIQTIAMVRWQMRKEAEIKHFKRVFKIPMGVVLDRIEARFDDLDSTLTIYMPKLKKGIQGSRIEEEALKAKDDEQGIDETSTQGKEIAAFGDQDLPKCLDQDYSAEEEILEDLEKPCEQTTHALEIEGKKELEETPKVAPLETECNIIPHQKEIPDIQDTAEMDKILYVELPVYPKPSAGKNEDLCLPEAQVQEDYETAVTLEVGPIEQEEIPECTKEEQLSLDMEMPKREEESHVEENRKDSNTELSERASEKVMGTEEEMSSDHGQILDQKTGVPERKEINEEETSNGVKKEKDQEQKQDVGTLEIGKCEERKKSGRRRRFCTPCAFAGSAFILSIVVLVIHLLKNKPTKRTFHAAKR